MRTMCSREIFTKECRQQQIFDLDLKRAWHYNHVTFTPITKKFMLYCRLIYMLSILCVRLTIKVKVGLPESFKVGWYPPPPPKKKKKKTGSSHLKRRDKSFQAQAEKPLGTDSHRTISKRSRECWLLIGHKKCLVLLCPIGEQFLLSSFREFVHDGYYLATVRN